MIYSTEELKKTLGSNYKIKSKIQNGELFKISHGIYSDESPYLSELENIFKRYPNAILTLQSAFSYYELSDYIPDKYVIATSQKAHKIDNPKVEQLYITKDILDIGKKTIKTEYGTINIYDKERLLIEVFRLKSKLPFSYYKEIVNSYRLLVAKEMIDLNLIIKYCSKLKNGQNIRKQIQEIIL